MSESASKFEPVVARPTKFWIGVACKEHVETGVKLGICQFCHGKSSPVKRLARGDWIVYYSSKVTMDEPDLYQKFTAIGQIVDDAPYQADMGGGFQPFRRNVRYLESAKHLDVRPLVPQLPFIRNKQAWGGTFRYGFLEIDRESFELIARGMVGFDPVSRN